MVDLLTANSTIDFRSMGDNNDTENREQNPMLNHANNYMDDFKRYGLSDKIYCKYEHPLNTVADAVTRQPNDVEGMYLYIGNPPNTKV